MNAKVGLVCKYLRLNFSHWKLKFVGITRRPIVRKYEEFLLRYKQEVDYDFRLALRNKKWILMWRPRPYICDLISATTSSVGFSWNSVQFLQKVVEQAWLLWKAAQWRALLGAFTKLRKATISSVISVCLSVRPHATTRLPLDKFTGAQVLWFRSATEAVQSVKRWVQFSAKHST
jgi:hypothetical protein